ncbi:MAG: hypothetical protein Q9227_007612 [Pyrenula ochraceoflavens]
MPRIYTANEQSMTLDLPAGLVTFKFPDPEDKENRTTIVIPEGSKWTPTLHWHEAYTEYLQVVKGRARFTVGDEIVERGPEDGSIRIDSYVPHEFMRADALKPDNEKNEGDVEVREWTDPDDGFREVFFYNVMSMFKESGGKLTPSNGMQLLATIAYVDNYVVLIKGPFGFYLTHGLYKIGARLAWLLGYKTWYEEYTPKRYHAIAAAGRQAKHGKSL